MMTICNGIYFKYVIIHEVYRYIYFYILVLMIYLKNKDAFKNFRTYPFKIII
jgi:hypothetical protein